VENMLSSGTDDDGEDKWSSASWHIAMHMPTAEFYLQKDRHRTFPVYCVDKYIVDGIQFCMSKI